jgi:hypothetical protein
LNTKVHRFFFRQKAESIVRRVTQGLDREQERLFTLMADARLGTRAETKVLWDMYFRSADHVIGMSQSIRLWVKD